MWNRFSILKNNKLYCCALNILCVRSRQSTIFHFPNDVIMNFKKLFTNVVSDISYVVEVIRRSCRKKDLKINLSLQNYRQETLARNFVSKIWPWHEYFRSNVLFTCQKEWFSVIPGQLFVRKVKLFSSVCFKIRRTRLMLSVQELGEGVIIIIYHVSNVCMILKVLRNIVQK